MKSICGRTVHSQCCRSMVQSGRFMTAHNPAQRYISSRRIVKRPPKHCSSHDQRPIVQRAHHRQHGFATVTQPSSPKVLVNDLQSQEVLVDFDNGTATRYPSFWLRDHCPCPVCTHPETKQRQVDTFELDPDTKAKDVEALSEGLKVIWTDADHESIYSWDWLQAHVPFTATPSFANPRGSWKTVSPSGPYPEVDYNNAMTTDAGLHTMLSQIRTYGLTFVKDTPVTPEATEALANRIAFIRQTHYGGFWEVVSEANPIDTAYTNLHLPNHTDNTYFTDPCGLQMFHCLSHTSDSSSSSSSSTSDQLEENLGGESTFTDGFAAASHLHNTHPQLYKTLSAIKIISHASGDPTAGPIFNNAVTSSGFPVFTHQSQTNSSSSIPKNLSQIRWNNSDRHSTTSFPTHQTLRTWYEAARQWNKIIHDPSFEITIKLKPGVVVIFDNWRVLHGRKAFRGRRRLCGAYVGMDDFLAKARLIEGRVSF